MRANSVVRTTGIRLPFGSLLFTLIAVATVGYFSYRYLATRASEAQVSAVRPYCELVTCRWGKCNSRRQMACEEIPSPLETDQHVRHFDQARVEFVGSDGRHRAAWAELGRTVRHSARVGDRISVHYIDGFGPEPEITSRPNLFLSLFGIAAFLFFLSIGARMHRSRWQGRF